MLKCSHLLELEQALTIRWLTLSTNLSAICTVGRETILLTMYVTECIAKVEERFRVKSFHRAKMF